MRALQAARKLPIVRLAGGPLRRVGRKVTPLWLKRRIAPLVFRIEKLEQQAPEPQHALAECQPLLPPEAFRDGPIVIVNNALAWGGAERQVVTTIRGLVQRQQKPVALLCLRLGETADNDFYLPTVVGSAHLIRNTIALPTAQAAIDRLTEPERARVRRAIAWLPQDVQDDIMRFLADFLAMTPAVVHAFQDGASIAAGYAATIAGVPRIITSGRNLSPVNFAYHRPYMADAYRLIAACPGIVMVNNSAAGARDYAQWLGLPPERLQVHRNGIDTDVIKAADPSRVAQLRAELGIPADVPVVGSIFRFYEEKRPLLWIEAAARIAARYPDAHFAIFGVGPLRDEVKAFAAAAGFGERLHAPGTTDDPGLALGLFDVFLLTSKFEGTPNTIIEASLMGVPVVTTRAGGTEEAVEAGTTGLVADGHDAGELVGELAGLVERILADPQWRARTRERGPAFIRERFGLDRMIDETLAFHQTRDEG